MASRNTCHNNIKGRRHHEPCWARLSHMLGTLSVALLGTRVVEDMLLREEVAFPHSGLQAVYITYSSQHDDRSCHGE